MERRTCAVYSGEGKIGHRILKVRDACKMRVPRKGKPVARQGRKATDLSEALTFLLRQRLSDEQAEFRHAPTVAEGLEIADTEGPFDVAIVDLLLPDGDGTDLVRRIKTSYPETRVAVLSSVQDLSGALEAGADEAIGKGTPLLEIVSDLARLVDGRAEQ